MGPLLGFFCGLVTVGLLLGVPLLLSAPLAALVLVTPVAAVLGAITSEITARVDMPRFAVS